MCSRHDFEMIGVILFRTRLKLSSCLWDSGIPLLVCTAYGMIAMMRLAVQEHTGEIKCLQ